MIPHVDCNELSTGCFNKLKKDILDGVYSPGEKLSMSKLKEDLNMGQSPIREALSRLLAIDLVQFEENKGFRVINVAEKDLSDLFLTIIQIENIAIKQALELGNDNWEIKLVAVFHQVALNEIKKELIQPLFWAESNISFYRCLILGCNSAYLIKIHDILFLKVEWYLKLAIRTDANFIEKCYQTKKILFEAVLRRDVEESCRLFTASMLEKLEDITDSLKHKFF